MTPSYPIIETFPDLETAQRRAIELLTEGFMVLKSVDDEDNWVGYSVFHPDTSREETYLLEFETPNPEGDPYAIFMIERTGVGVFNPRGITKGSITTT